MIGDPLFDIPVVLKVKGIKGDKGERGEDGAAGRDGINGRDGVNGIDGVDGANGKDGINGKDGLSGKNGIDGKSAYQLWLSLGNTGSVEDFILSLRGEDGLSAYEIWIADGNDGTQSEFLTWLKGKDGATYQNIGMSVPDLAGQVGRLKAKDSILSTDDIMIRRAGSLFRVPFINVITAVKPYIIKSEDYSLLGTDCYVELDTAGVTATLPTAIGVAGKEYNIDNSSIGDVFGDAELNQTINGELIQVIPPNSNMKVVSNGTNWRIK